MPSKVRKIGRVQIIDKYGCRHSFEVCECDGVLSIAEYCRRRCGENDRPALKSNKLQPQDQPPVKEPPPKEPDREPPRQPPVKIK